MLAAIRRLFKVGWLAAYHTPDASGIGIDGLGLQALELEVLEVGLIALVKISLGFVRGIHAGESSRNIAKSPNRIEGVKVHDSAFQGWRTLLRVAASSNFSIKGTPTSGLRPLASAPQLKR